jgi:hypothetical protein
MFRVGIPAGKRLLWVTFLEMKSSELLEGRFGCFEREVG